MRRGACVGVSGVCLTSDMHCKLSHNFIQQLVDLCTKYNKLHKIISQNRLHIIIIRSKLKWQGEYQQ